MFRPFGTFGPRPRTCHTPSPAHAARCARPVGATACLRAPLGSRCRVGPACQALRSRVPPSSLQPRPAPAVPTSVRIVPTITSRGITPPPDGHLLPLLASFHHIPEPIPLPALAVPRRAALSSAQLPSFGATSAVAYALAALGAPPPFRRAARPSSTEGENRQSPFPSFSPPPVLPSLLCCRRYAPGGCAMPKRRAP
jgi:hypothetical protein